MKKLFLICAIPILLFDFISAPDNAFINCTWPCPDPKQGCIVTTTTAFCGSRVSDLWMINEPEKSPFYTGAYVSIELQPCQKVPIPPLPSAPLNTTAKQGETIIQWPVASVRRPQDEYLGNCGHGLYCSSSGQDKLYPVCRHRFELSLACNSSNQCLSRFCLDGVCQTINNSTKKGDQTKEHHNYSHPSHNSTGHILAGVFGSFGAVIIGLAGFFIYRRQKNIRGRTEKVEPELMEETSQFQENAHSRNSAIFNNSSSRRHSSFLSASDRELVEKQFASDFQQENINTPAMQQRDLQHSLREQSSSSNINIVPDDDAKYLKPPPSYKP
ncbi:unnamed protein product [Mucor hiemalis]